MGGGGVSKFLKWQEENPVFLVIVQEETDVVFQDLVYPLSLTIGTSCAVPPDVLDGSHNGNETYPYGIVIKYHCMESFTLIGSPSIYCDVDDNNGKALWRGKPPKCKAAICPNPVVQDGIKLSGFRDSYTYGNSITYECKIGYFIIGSYFIRCEENSAWVPKVPSCKKISPDVCGAPIIPEGTLYPLQPEYKIGNVIAVYCNPNYSFLDETTKMNVQCQGYNQWDPPVPPCFFRTSPDTSELYIHHGRIVLGEKRRYNPGDEVTIECYPGYTLKGSSKINYVGGKKWLPNIPVCSLTCFLPVLIVASKTAYEKSCSPQRLPEMRRQVQESTTATKEVTWLPERKEESTPESEPEYQRENGRHKEQLVNLNQFSSGLPSNTANVTAYEGN
ncbi:C4b-binding protein alpha chain-like [Rhineura floridana]|uniref:C4b-binding protein alpha chain-like n=1 Tax=Rhineura floridana TaxID=261503 RepID=UPI002AC7F1EE|nr:C4b-binding protein alpha chain-like [Rhineura floridana]